MSTWLNGMDMAGMKPPNLFMDVFTHYEAALSFFKLNYLWR